MKEKLVSRPIQIGDRVYGHLKDDSADGRCFYGEVIYIHPQNRFCRVRFDVNGHGIVECFYLDGNGRAYDYTGNYHIRLLDIVTGD